MNLTDNLVGILGFRWGDMTIEDFTDKNKTPRKIKDTLNTLFQLGKFTINRKDLNSL